MKNNTISAFSVTGLLRTTAFAIASLAIVSMTSCKKDDNNEATPAPSNTPVKTKTEMLTGSSWVMSAATISPAVDGQTDMFGMMGECEKDNVYTFKADQSLIVNEGAKKCDMMDPQEVTKSWAFGQEETRIVIGFTEYAISELTEKKLTGTTTMNMMGKDYTVTTTWSAK